MNIRNTLIRTVLVVMILGLAVTAPAFAQDTTNTCHLVNPLHATDFPNTCVSDYDWKVGWCRAKVFQNGYRIIAQYDRSAFPAEPVVWDVAKYRYYPRDIYYGGLCENMYLGDWPDDHLSASFRRTYPDWLDWYRDLRTIHNPDDENQTLWLHTRTLTLLSSNEYYDLYTGTYYQIVSD